MNQTRLGSLIEAIINVVIGFAINFTANMLIFPLFGFHITARDNLSGPDLHGDQRGAVVLHSPLVQRKAAHDGASGRHGN